MSDLRSSVRHVQAIEAVGKKSHGSYFIIYHLLEKNDDLNSGNLASVSNRSPHGQRKILVMMYLVVTPKEGRTTVPLPCWCVQEQQVIISPSSNARTAFS
jgi:hypothetical protein